MCLYTDQTRAKIAKEDIVVYKVLDTEYGLLLSPYYSHSHWSIGRTKKSKLHKQKDRSSIPIDKYAVNEGLHACRTIQRAFDRIGTTVLTTSKVFEAIIPKGAKYYFGQKDEAASDKLKLTGKYYPNIDSKPKKWNE